MPMSNINHVVLTGRLTSDPDLHSLPSGSSICLLRIAVNGRRRDPAGAWSEKPNFFSVVVFGAYGETVAKYMHKGRPVAIDGRLNWREWKAEDGRNFQAVSIIAQTVQFLGSPPSDDANAIAGELDAGGLQSIAGDEDPEEFLQRPPHPRGDPRYSLTPSTSSSAIQSA
jgi:single-strand DNA-binding protein